MQIISEAKKDARYYIFMNLIKELGFKSITAFQKANKLTADGLVGLMTYNALYKKILNVVDLQNFGGHFYPQIFPKNQIVWHHSAGWDDARGMFDWWRADGVQHVATAIGIIDDGKVFRGYDEQFWAHHIGMQNWQNLSRNQQSVAVEICNWGALKDDYTTWIGHKISAEKVIELNYKGIKFYEAYTDEEIKALKYWTLLNAMRFGIDLTYNEKDMWQVSANAINGKNGLYTHNSFIEWKSDVSPQPKLIEMAKSLASYQQSILA